MQNYKLSLPYFQHKVLLYFILPTSIALQAAQNPDEILGQASEKESTISSDERQKIEKELKTSCWKQLDKEFSDEKMKELIADTKGNPDKLKKTICNTAPMYHLGFLYHVINKDYGEWEDVFRSSSDSENYANENWFLALCDAFHSYLLSQHSYEFFIPYMVKLLLQSGNHKMLNELLYRMFHSNLINASYPNENRYLTIWTSDAVKPLLSEEEASQLVKISEKLPDYSKKRSHDDKKAMCTASFVYTLYIGIRQVVEHEMSVYEN